jgi:hypothetical protein
MLLMPYTTTPYSLLLCCLLTSCVSTPLFTSPAKLRMQLQPSSMVPTESDSPPTSTRLSQEDFGCPDGWDRQHRLRGARRIHHGKDPQRRGVLHYNHGFHGPGRTGRKPTVCRHTEPSDAVFISYRRQSFAFTTNSSVKEKGKAASPNPPLFDMAAVDAYMVIPDPPYSIPATPAPRFVTNISSSFAQVALVPTTRFELYSRHIPSRPLEAKVSLSKLLSFPSQDLLTCLCSRG